MADEYKEAVNPGIVKFEKTGDEIEGVFLSSEESRLYPDSFSIRVMDGDVAKSCFVNNIVVDLMKNNNIQSGDKIKIVYQGKVKTKDGRKEYKNFKLFFKKIGIIEERVV